MMGEMLFLAHRIPFPPDRGDKIRSHHLLKAAASTGPVHVGTFGDTDADFLHKNTLAGVASSYKLLRRRKSMVRAGLEALVSGKPISLTAFYHAGMDAWVRRILNERTIDTIVVFSGQMAQYVPPEFAGKVIVDLCDVDSAKFASYAESGRRPRRWIDGREAVKLADVETEIAERADKTLLVTQAEADLFLRRANPSRPENIAAVRNGIDTRFFDPKAVKPHADLPSEAGPHLVFTGQMDYQPNIAAVIRAANSILPGIRRIYPSAQFHVVGRAPVAALRALDGQGGIRVWGEVPDVRPFLAAADIVLAPLTIARGVQNKVLEAMAMGRPVLLSPEAATGIEAADGTHFAVAADDTDFALRAEALLGDTLAASKMGLAARNYVMEQQSWPAMLAPFVHMLRDTSLAACDAA